MSNKDAISQHLQDCFVYLCITSSDFLGLVRPILYPDYFTSAICSNCIRLCYDFWDMFNHAPGDHFHDELVRRLPEIGEEDSGYYVEYLQRIQQMSPPDFDYVLRRLSNFIQCREYESAAIRFAELVREGDYEDAQNVMYSALKSGVEKENIGCDYLSDLSGIMRRLDTDAILIPTGIEALDRLLRGYQRGDLGLIVGSYKGKKSWAIQHIAKMGLLHGKKVVYISHELSRKKLELRMDRMCGALVDPLTIFGREPSKKLEEGQEVVLRYRNKDGCIKIDNEYRPSVYDDKHVKKIRKRMERFGGRLIIKKYPMN